MLDSTVLEDAVVTQDTVTQLVAAIRRVRRLIPAAHAVKLGSHDYDRPGKPDCDWDDSNAKQALVSGLVNDALAVLAEKHDMTLVDMAIAFVLAHPAVSSAIIGPRTMDQLESQLGAADISLTAEILDAIDEIVPPGTNSSPNDGGYDPPELTDAGLRRRST